jgi:uncharacterized lipoprotein
MPRLIVPITVLAGAVALAGCASHPCRNELSYRDASAHAPPVIPQGLKTPPPDKAYEIPSGKVAKKGPKTRNACVMFPPQVINPENPPKQAG